MESAEKRAAELTESMIECVRLATGGSGIREDLIPGARVSALIPSDEVYTCLMSPVVGVLLSGEKTLLTESGSITYGGGSCYLIGMEKTGSFLFRADDTGQPLQSVSVMLDAQLLRELLAKVPARPQAGGFEGKKLGTYQVRKTPLYLLEAFARLADLVRHPEDAEVMAPLIIREIHYRLVTGPWRDSIAEIFGQDGSVNRLAKSIRWMTDHYSESFDLGKVAEMAHMSPATFNRHFRALMQESPLQYKRSVRLIMARRFIENERMSADEAAGRVGYKSVSQFHRDYKKRFGLTPGESSGGGPARAE